MLSFNGFCCFDSNSSCFCFNGCICSFSFFTGFSIGFLADFSIGFSTGFSIGFSIGFSTGFSFFCSNG
ncbi:hypothetical protein DS031_02380 [Bacillus taeanensis]|uniref:Uncharacterized protein n=1 Tax=Bacillus taeanensis TaxID=273032 RepID=A0A366Y5G1_9BACI|nr:hypothetical protein DS031_02380 [Bacillus taeanensis]